MNISEYKNELRMQRNVRSLKTIGVKQMGQVSKFKLPVFKPKEQLEPSRPGQLVNIVSEKAEVNRIDNDEIDDQN